MVLHKCEKGIIMYLKQFGHSSITGIGIETSKANMHYARNELKHFTMFWDTLAGEERRACRKIRFQLTHWGRVTHICVGKLTILGSDNGLSPRRRQAIIWTNAGVLLIGPLGTNFSEILIGIQIFSFNEMRLKMSSAKWRPFCLGLNELIWTVT